MAKQKELSVELKPVKVESFTITLVGDSPLLSHKWSEKAKRQILDAQMKRAKTGRETRNPVKDFVESLYWITPMPEIEDEADFEKAKKAKARFGFPSTAFKQAAVSAGFRAGVLKNKVETYGAFHIDGDLVMIKGLPTLHESMVRLSGISGAADIRFRAEFKIWETSFTIRYNSAVTSPEILINLFNLGGFSVGVGEWRPEKSGQHGMFHVKTD